MRRKKSGSVIAGLFLCALTATTLVVVAQQQEDDCPVLIWSDEFSGTSLNTSNWEPQIGNGCDISPDLCGWGNGELQWYLAENAVVESGRLKIIAKQQVAGDRSYYTSARIRSRGLLDLDLSATSYQLEARIKVPNGMGLWPAFWMLPTNVDVTSWPLGGEIDILEYIGREPNQAHGYLHYGNAWNDRSIVGGPIQTPDAVSDQFHIYSIEKRLNRIDFLLDHHLYQSYTSQDVEPKFMWPFEDTFHFILNLAVGGNWPEFNIHAENFPATLEVDYVRVYDISTTSSGSMVGPRLVHVSQGSVEYCIVNATYDSLSWSVPNDAWYTITMENCIEVNFGVESGYVQVETLGLCGNQAYAVPVLVEAFYETEFTFVTPNDDDEATYETSTGIYSVETVDGIDTVKYIRDIGQVYDSIQYSTLAITNPSDYVEEEKKFHMDILSATAAPCTRVLIQLEDESATAFNYPMGRHSRHVAYIDKVLEGEWQRLEFSYYDQPDDSVTSVVRIVILLDSYMERADTYYIRNFDSAKTGCIGTCEPLSTNTCRRRAKSEAGACTDGINNDGFGYDGDGPIDCDDSDCWNDSACLVIATPNPTPQSTLVVTTPNPTPAPTSVEIAPNPTPQPTRGVTTPPGPLGEVEYDLDCGAPQLCNIIVLNTNVPTAGLTCGELISELMGAQGYSQDDACRKVAGQDHPVECGECIHAVITCGNPSVCSNQVLNSISPVTPSNVFTCRDRISWVVYAEGASELDACTKVSNEEANSEICGPCDPSTSVTPPPKPSPSPTPQPTPRPTSEATSGLTPSPTRNDATVDCDVATCTSDVLNTVVDTNDGSTCLDKIKYLMNEREYDELYACDTVTRKQYPSQCGGCDPMTGAPFIDYSFDCGVPDLCNNNVLNTDTPPIAATCGERIIHLVEEEGYSEEDACRTVAGIDNPLECGECVYAVITCGKPNVCTNEVLDSISPNEEGNMITCRDRISWVVYAEGMSELNACRKVATEAANIAVCGPCDPDS